MATPKNAVAFTMDVAFFLGGSPVASPTLAAGDVKVSINGAAEGNINTLPTVKTWGAEMLLSAAEMTGGRTLVRFEDQTVPRAWDSFTITLNYDTRNVDDIMPTFTLPTNFSALSITGGGLVDITQAAADKVWGSITRTLTAGFTLSAAERNAIADALLDQTDGVETGLTLRQKLRLSAAVLFGKVSGMGTNSPAFRDFADTKDRVTATTDASGNRSSVTTDPT